MRNKQLRWWWNNTHQAIYDDGDGSGWAPHGPQTEWAAQSKSISFIEYGFSAVDKATNQPNVFFDSKSVESATPFWSIWDPAPGLTLPAAARRHDRRARAPGGLRILEHGRQQRDAAAPASSWCNGRSVASGTGTRGRSRSSRSTTRNGATPATGSRATGRTGCASRCRRRADPAADARRPMRPSRPSRRSDGRFMSGRSSRRWSPITFRAARARALRFSRAYRDVELTYEVLRSDAAHAELQAIAGFFAEMGGAATPFWFAPPGLSAASTGRRSGRATARRRSFRSSRPIGGYGEAVDGTSGVSAVYLERRRRRAPAGR